MHFELIDNFVFDFDHTLIDTDLAFAAYWRTLQQQLYLHSRLPVAEIEMALNDTRCRLESQFFAGRLDLIKGALLVQHFCNV